MKRKRFAFVMDALEALNLPWDTSLSLLRELNRLGHETYLFLPSRLAIENGNVHGFGKRLRAAGPKHYRLGAVRRWNLADFDAVFIRKDPPFDAAYLALTYVLEPLADQTVVINHPRGIRNANEKLWGLGFSRWSPPSVATASVEEILSFQEKRGADVVIKPLYEKGGRGVFLLPQRTKGARRLLERATRREKDPVLVQKFITVPKGGGDKRILLWKEEILGAFERIPREGEFRSNLSLGGRFRATVLTREEKKMILELAPELVKQGLHWTGVDVRGERLLEVNVTSPAGLVELDELYGGATHRLAKRLEAPGP